ncbi:MAG: phosphodiester glycosidase family protein [Leptolyngbyaceae cyanobacterium bins.302]|nr:phosphodiester glycosidase family protein [Leptolyngbyaceae cyanobacterium bins.302]
MPDRKSSFFIFLSLAGMLVACAQGVPSSQPSPIPSTPSPLPEKKLEYDLHKLPRSIVHTLKIPAQSQFVVTTAVSSKLQTVEEFADSSQAIAVLNGGFFDPENQKSTASIFQNGQQIAKPEDNDRLMNNLNLLPYLDRILNRSEFRRYQCGSSQQYDITPRQELPPTDCQLQDALGAGPQLLPFSTLREEGFLDGQNGTVIRDALGHNQPNARSAIGITRDGSLLLVLASQNPDNSTNSGLSILELTDFMKKQGVEKALNLDGGTSSALFFQGETFYGKVNESGEPIARPVKSVLLVKSTKKPEQ